MDIKEPKLQLPQGGASAQPRLVNDMPNGSPIYDDAEEWSSCVTESIPYDMYDALSWNYQVVDMGYTSLFQDMFEFNLDHQSSVPPK